MSYYNWKVVDGVLGTAILTGGQTDDFSPATIKPSRSRKTPNLVDLLRSEVDDSPLGQILAKVMGARLLSKLYVEAVPNPNSLLPPGVSSRPTFAPKMEFRLQRYSAQEYFPTALLSVLRETLNHRDSLRDFLPDMGDDARDYVNFNIIRLDDLPIELECVVAVSLEYAYLGETFLVDRTPTLLGLHERSVTELEHQLSPSRSEYLHAIIERNRLCRARRRVRWHLRQTLEKLMAELPGALRDPQEFKSILAWIAQDGREDLTPRSLKESLTALTALYQVPTPKGIREEFAPLKRDILEKVRELAAAEVGQPV